MFHAPPSTRPTVLFVEDDDDLWKLIHRRLGDEWASVRASSDVEACVLMRDLGPRLACLVTDVNLSGSTLSGVDLIRLIRGSLPPAKTPAWAGRIPIARQLPILVTSGSKPHLALATQAGATRVLREPFAFAAPQDALRRHAPPSPMPVALPAMPRPSPS